MAYARFGAEGSRVYVFLHVDGPMVCWNCGLPDTSDHHVWMTSTGETVAHLESHRAAGDHVPDIEAELWADDAENFPVSA